MLYRSFPVLLILSMLLLSCSANKETDSSGNIGDKGDPEGRIEFEKTAHDFGTIVQGEEVGYSFSFTNQGEGSLIVLDASASCGCTVPRFSKAPVPPGESGTIEVKFDSSGRIGRQSKSITIRSNGKNPVVSLTIRAYIIESNT